MSAARIFNQKFSAKHLIDVYADRIKNSGAIGLDRTRPVALAERLNAEIEVITRKVKAGSYRFTPYKEKLILKGSNSFPRQISIPTARDCIVMRALCDSLKEVFPEARLALPQVVIDSLKKALSTNNYKEYAKIDLQSFYPSISHKLIKSSISFRVRKPEFRCLIEAAITTPTVPEVRGGRNAISNSAGVPQGLAISNILAEIALRSIDNEFGSMPGVWYKRYVDDILLLTDGAQAETVANLLIVRLKSLGLSPHAIEPGSKSQVAKLGEPFTFLGYEVDRRYVRIRRESILRFESSIAKIFTAYRHKLATARSRAEKQRALAYCRWKVNLRITGCIFEGKRLGWVVYFSQITTTEQLRAVNNTIKKLLIRFSLSEKMAVKSLIKTFYELRRGDKGSHAYIPNFDQLTTGQKREVLAMWLGEAAMELSPKDVERRFSFRISKAVRELEEDIAHIS